MDASTRLPGAASIDIEAWHRFAQPAEVVFDAWFNPASAGRWLFATRDGEMRVVDIDPRVGGHFLFVERREDADAEHFGRYLKLERPHLLHFAFGVDRNDPNLSEVHVLIEPLDDGGCELTLTHHLDLRWAAYAERTREGWSTVLDHLEAALTRP